MSTYVFARNGMGDYTTGTGMREDMLMQAFNIFLNQAGVVLSTDLAVTEKASGADMSVDVAPGRCFVLNSSYVVNTANTTRFWGMLSDAVTNLAISTNTSGSTRYDLIIAQIDSGAAANDYATNVGSIVVEEGIAGSGQPATPSNSLLLAVLEIPDGTTTQIVDADITDSRTKISIVNWESYTPVVGGGGGLGNGSIIGYSQKIGKTRNVIVEWTLGGTSTLTASPTFTLPEAADSIVQTIGRARLVDTGTNTYDGTVQLEGGGSVITLYTFDVSGTYPVRTDLTSIGGAPFTWAGSDVVLAIITYPTAV